MTGRVWATEPLGYVESLVWAEIKREWLRAYGDPPIFARQLWRPWTWFGRHAHLRRRGARRGNSPR